MNKLLGNEYTFNFVTEFKGVFGNFSTIYDC